VAFNCCCRVFIVASISSCPASVASIFHIAKNESF
jgi:hypothetical protein